MGAGQLFHAQSPLVRWPATDLGPASLGIQRGHPLPRRRALVWHGPVRYGEENCPVPGKSKQALVASELAPAVTLTMVTYLRPKLVSPSVPCSPNIMCLWEAWTEYH